MPAKSKSQQRAAGAALAAKRGEQPKGDLQRASKEIYSSMDEEQLKDIAHTKLKGLPDYK